MHKHFSHSLGGIIPVAHGQAVAAKAAVNEVYKLVEDLDVPTLEEQGVSPDMTDRLTKEAMKDPQTVGNPRALTGKDYVWIYKRCFNQTPKTV